MAALAAVACGIAAFNEAGGEVVLQRVSREWLARITSSSSMELPERCSVTQVNYDSDSSDTGDGLYIAAFAAVEAHVSCRPSCASDRHCGHAAREPADTDDEEYLAAFVALESRLAAGEVARFAGSTLSPPASQPKTPLYSDTDSSETGDELYHAAFAAVEARLPLVSSRTPSEYDISPTQPFITDN